MKSFQEIGDRPNLAETFTHLGDCYHALGDVDQAQAAWRQALAVLTTLVLMTRPKVRAKLE